LDLYVDVTKFALNIANGCVGCSLSLSEPHHLLWPLGFHPSAIEHERVAVTAISVGSVIAQPWQRPRQFIGSLL
jgi:hypothetical protein